ncbi:hypothetical protein LWI28_026493 [Acer negundo]|uniref:Uncharacterized protein n=1 Tax=Acer negundo TaxID=4023 RepID=A0AAD5IP15_ACENE|nr:hypothetical protein LWI28_026493 [Acer negundo]
MYAKPSHTHVSQLQEDLALLSQGSDSITKYMQRDKSIVDTIGLMDAYVGEIYLVIHILRGLNQEFKEITNAVRAHETPINFEELYKKLLNHEGSLKRDAARTNDTPITANFMAKPNHFNKGNHSKQGCSNNGNQNQ